MEGRGKREEEAKKIKAWKKGEVDCFWLAVSSHLSGFS